MKDLGKVIAIIECRMGSSRLPGKVLLKIDGKTILEILCERIKQCEYIDEIVFATTDLDKDEPIVELAIKIGVGVYRGSEDNVLSRVADAAKAFGAETCVCITGDCPLIDPEIIGQLIDLYRYNKCDRAECNPPSGSLYPDGLGSHIVNVKDMEYAKLNAVSDSEKEHVVLYFRNNKDKYKCAYLPPQKKIMRPDIQITLDEKADFDLISNIYSALVVEDPFFGANKIIEYLDKNKELLQINEAVHRKTP